MTQPVQNSIDERISNAIHIPLVLHARVITGTGGGPDKTILNSPRFLPELGYQAVCAFLHPPGDPGFEAVRRRATEWQAPIEEIVDRSAIDWRVLPHMLQLCRRLKVSIWHAHDYKTNLIGLWLRRFHSMRLVTTVHGWVEYTPRTRLYYLLDRWSLPRYERVICVSQDLLDRCRQYGVKANHASLIENAVDTDQFCRRQTREEAKRQLDWPQNQLLIGSVGRLSGEKAFHLLIGSVATLVQQGIDVGLMIAGDGSERTSLMRQITSLGLVDRVRLLGFQQDLHTFYQALDVFALSSIREGLPNVLLEAMSYAVPVVATHIAGIPRLITNGNDGRLVEAGNESQLAMAIAELLGSDLLREQLGSCARQTILARYSFNERMRKVAGVYDDLFRSP